MPFEKYKEMDAYHWNLAECKWTNWDYNPPMAARQQAVVDCIPPDSGRILDIGCGDGYLLYRGAMAAPGAKLAGVDLEAKAIDLAKSKLENYGHQAELHICGCDAIPFSDGSIDTVIMSDVIEHLPDTDAALREIRRVLVSNGTAIISTPNRQEDFVWDPEYHVQEFSHTEFKALLSPYFAQVSIVAHWPMTWMRQWRLSPLSRTILRLMACSGFDPFRRSTREPDSSWGQLTAICTGPLRSNPG